MTAAKKQGSQANAYLVCGEDDYLVSSKAKEIVDSIIPPAEQLTALETIQGNAGNADEVAASAARIKAALSSGGLFSSRKCVWVRDVSFISSGKTSQSEGARDAVASLVEFLKKGLSPDSFLVVSADKADKRGAFYKFFASAGEVCEFGSGKQYEQEKDAAAFAAAKASELGLKMDQAVMRAFLEKVGTASRLLVSELEKLSLYVGDAGAATLRDVEEITSPSRTAVAWDLADAFGEKDLVKTLKVLRRLLYQNENEMGIIIGLQSRLRDLIVYREGLDRGWLKKGGRWYEWGEVSSDAEGFFSGGSGRADPRATHPYRVNVLGEQAAKFSLAELRAMFRLSVAAQERLVSSGESKESVLETLVVRLLRKRRPVSR